MDIRLPTGKNKIVAIGVGIAFMVIALIPQFITQEIPTIIVLVRYGAVNLIKIMSGFELSNPILWALFIGGTAAIYQESMKYFAVNTQSKYLTIWIGLGFALVDIAVLFIESGSPLIRTFSWTLLVLIALNTFSSLIFHPGTALILKYGRTVRKGIYFLLFTILLHGIEDGGLVYADIYVILHQNLYMEVISAFCSVTICISVAAFLMGMKYRRFVYSSKADENTIRIKHFATFGCDRKIRKLNGRYIFIIK
ncbi:MAG: hypothetical protein ACP5UZ_07550 [Thermoplasmata archaeon]